MKEVEVEMEELECSNFGELGYHKYDPRGITTYIVQE